MDLGARKWLAQLGQPTVYRSVQAKRQTKQEPCKEEGFLLTGCCGHLRTRLVQADPFRRAGWIILEATANSRQIM